MRVDEYHQRTVSVALHRVAAIASQMLTLSERLGGDLPTC
jgi:hypothetical protein